MSKNEADHYSLYSSVLCAVMREKQEVSCALLLSAGQTKYFTSKAAHLL